MKNMTPIAIQEHVAAAYVGAAVHQRITKAMFYDVIVTFKVDLRFNRSRRRHCTIHQMWVLCKTISFICPAFNI